MSLITPPSLRGQDLMSNFIKNVILYQRVAAWFVLLLSLVLTFVVTAFSYDANRKQLYSSFEFKVVEIEQRIMRRIRDVDIVLRASAGLLYASDKVTEGEWEAFVTGLNLSENFPELHGLGYINLSGNTVPVGSVFQSSSNALLKKFDLSREDQAAAEVAMDQAMTSGLPVISSVLSLHEKDPNYSQPGFILYFPVYRSNNPFMSTEERRRAIVGFVFTYFTAQQFMQSAVNELGGEMHLQVYEGQGTDKLVFDSHPEIGLTHATDERGKSNLITWPMQNWTLIAYLHENELDTFLKIETVAVALLGLAADFIVFFLFLSLARRKKELELEAQEIQIRLTNTESVLVSSVEAIGEAFVVYDEHDRLVFFNDKYREIYLASAPIIQLGNTFEDIIRYGAERGQYAAALGRVDEWVAERLAIHLEGKTDLIQLLDSGVWLKIRERKTPSGHIVGFRVDVTELYAAKEKAEASNKAKSNFLATMSHEIRTPMNGMLGMAQVLLSPKINEEERVDAARAILRSGQTLLNLLNDILDLSKIEAGKFKLEQNVFSPIELIRECVFLNSESAQRKQLSLHSCSSMDSSACFIADDTRLRQMLGNLISNAIKFTQVGRIEVAVDLHTDETLTQYLRFSVIDSGPGIPEEKRSHLFLPFVQADSSISRQFGGTGLGLSIVSQLATMMEGETGVESTLGSGSKFWFTIKAIQASDQLVGSTKSVKSDLSRAFDAGVPQFVGHALVAEDDAVSRVVLMSALAKMGLTIVAVDNGEKAVNAVMNGETFDLVFMDLSMPVMDGYLATTKILDWQRQKGKKLSRIIAISADAFEDSRKRCREHGMNGFVEKPLDFNRLSKEIAAYLPQSGVASISKESVGEVDEAKIIEWIDLIIPLLQQQKFDAFEHFKQLKSYVADSDIFFEIDAIWKILNDLQFELAADRLRDLANSRSWKLSS